MNIIPLSPIVHMATAPDGYPSFEFIMIVLNAALIGSMALTLMLALRAVLAKKIIASPKALIRWAWVVMADGLVCVCLYLVFFGGWQLYVAGASFAVWGLLVLAGSVWAIVKWWRKTGYYDMIDKLTDLQIWVEGTKAYKAFQDFVTKRMNTQLKPIDDALALDAANRADIERS